MYGKIIDIRKLSAQSVVPCSDRTVKCFAGEIKLQEQMNDLIFTDWTLELILLKSFKRAALETDRFLSTLRSL